MKVIVDQNGTCMGYHYQKDMPVDLPDNVISALGNHVKKNFAQKVAAVAEKTIEAVGDVINPPSTDNSYKSLKARAEARGMKVRPGTTTEALKKLVEESEAQPQVM